MGDDADESHPCQSVTMVANRLPATLADNGAWTISPGGLVSALTPVIRATDGTWIGWNGNTNESGGPLDVAGLHLMQVSLSEEEFEGYYCHMANRVLWPLFHDGVRAPSFQREAWEGYTRVNQRFAEVTASSAPDNGCVWIHDYHFLLLPGMLRALRPDLRIGLFLHVPVPPKELFASLPWRRQIVDSLLEADLIGTQTSVDAGHLRAILRNPSMLGVGRATMRVQVEAFPISLDARRYSDAARSAELTGRVDELRRSLGPGRVIFLGVDRLDYTKGIDLRLEALEIALQSGAIDPGEIRFLQVAVPSRRSVEEYREINDRVDMLVGRINGRFGGMGESVVHYQKQQYDLHDLATFYRAADVMVVTPIRDGMNLVAKEYVASRYDHTGELILSEFAGAAHELSAATIVNPHDVHALADALVAAVRRGRERGPSTAMRDLHLQVCGHDVHQWAARFLRALSRAHGGGLSSAASSPREVGTGASDEST